MGHKILRGFTLVELLIVVAIVGTLATVGVPVFSKMVRKSRQAEAKAALGGIYTLERAFHAEWGGYGNQIQGIGMSVPADNPTNYNLGFMGTVCDYSTDLDAPDPALPVGSLLNAKYPSYYTFTGARSGMNALNPNARPPSGGPGCIAGQVAMDGSSFRASANGVPSLKPGGPIDSWTIDQDRNLRNDQSGL